MLRYGGGVVKICFTVGVKRVPADPDALQRRRKSMHEVLGSMGWVVRSKVVWPIWKPSPPRNKFQWRVKTGSDPSRLYFSGTSTNIVCWSWLWCFCKPVLPRSCSTLLISNPHLVWQTLLCVDQYIIYRLLQPDNTHKTEFLCWAWNEW